MTEKEHQREERVQSENTRHHNIRSICGRHLVWSHHQQSFRSFDPDPTFGKTEPTSRAKSRSKRRPAGRFTNPPTAGHDKSTPPPRLDGGTVIESWAWTQFIKLTFHWWFRHVTTLWVQFVETFFLYRRDALWAVMGSPCYHQVWTRPEHCSQRQVCFQSN